MSKYFFCAIMAICMALNLNAQHAGRKSARLTRQEFEVKHRQYIVEHANLNEEEAKAFFALFDEFQEKKDALAKSDMNFAEKLKEEDLTDEECDKMVMSKLETRIRIAELEKAYHKKYKKVLSPRKILKIHRAEVAFHRHLLRQGRSMNN